MNSIKSLILISLFALQIVSSAVPSNLYLFNVNNAKQSRFMTINIETGNVTNVPTTGLNNYYLIGMAEITSDGFLIFGAWREGSEAYYGLLNVDFNGIFQNKSVGVLENSQVAYSWYPSSYGYDNQTKTFYQPIDIFSDNYEYAIFAFDFQIQNTSLIPLNITNSYSSPTCALYGTEYFILSTNLNNESSTANSPYELYIFNTQTKSQSPSVALSNLPENSAVPFLFYTNSQLYAVVYNLYQPTLMSVLSINPDTGVVDTIFQYSTEIENSENYWFSENYFVFLAFNNINYVIITLDLNTQQIIQKAVFNTNAFNPDFIQVGGIY